MALAPSHPHDDLALPSPSSAASGGSGGGGERGERRWVGRFIQHPIVATVMWVTGLWDPTEGGGGLPSSDSPRSSSSSLASSSCLGTEPGGAASSLTSLAALNDSVSAEWLASGRRGAPGDDCGRHGGGSSASMSDVNTAGGSTLTLRPRWQGHGGRDDDGGGPCGLASSSSHSFDPWAMAPPAEDGADGTATPSSDWGFYVNITPQQQMYTSAASSRPKPSGAATQQQQAEQPPAAS